MKPIKSIIASIWVVRILLLLLAASAFFVPVIGEGYSLLATNTTNIAFSVAVGIYALYLPALGTMVALHMLLSNINKGNVFVKKNTTYLTLVCAGVFLVGVISFFISLVSWVFSLISLAFLFVGLILLVLRNIFNYAVEIKEENDFTI